MIELKAPNGFIYRHISTKKVIGENLYFGNWEQYSKYELIKK